VSEAEHWKLWEMEMQVPYRNWPNYMWPDEHLTREVKVRDYYREHKDD
jgi:hypothetical protein